MPSHISPRVPLRRAATRKKVFKGGVHECNDYADSGVYHVGHRGGIFYYYSNPAEPVAEKLRGRA